MANVTNVTASSAGGVYRFSGSSFSSNLADQAFWIETKYSSVNSVTVTIGRDTSAGSGSANRFALSFQSASWTNGITTAVPLPVRTITYDANGATSGNVPSATSGAGALIIANNSGALGFLQHRVVVLRRHLTLLFTHNIRRRRLRKLMLLLDY